MNATTILLAKVIVALGHQLDADGKRRAASKLREMAVEESQQSSVEFLDSVADSLDHYAEEVELWFEDGRVP